MWAQNNRFYFARILATFPLVVGAVKVVTLTFCDVEEDVA